MKFSIHKVVAVAVPALVTASAFAEGEGSGSAADVSAATGAINSIQGGLEAIIGALATPVASLVVAGVAIWAIPKVARALKRAFSGGQG